MSVTKPVVALIEDDEAVLDSLRLYLVTKGFKVSPHLTAETFLAELDPHKLPDCIVSDVRLPGLSGLGLQKELVSRRLQCPLAQSFQTQSESQIVDCAQDSHQSAGSEMGNQSAVAVQALADPGQERHFDLAPNDPTLWAAAMGTKWDHDTVGADDECQFAQFGIHDLMFGGSTGLHVGDLGKQCCLRALSGPAYP